ncbi:hypothetical protein TNCV_112381 [Trichonephila clavipes]|nr:hypothetical protein TNCV_112381 [Trichonephila clavipes]
MKRNKISTIHSKNRISSHNLTDHGCEFVTSVAFFESKPRRFLDPNPSLFPVHRSCCSGRSIVEREDILPLEAEQWDLRRIPHCACVPFVKSDIQTCIYNG